MATAGADVRVGADAGACVGATATTAGADARVGSDAGAGTSAATAAVAAAAAATVAAAAATVAAAAAAATVVGVALVAFRSGDSSPDDGASSCTGASCTGARDGAGDRRRRGEDSGERSNESEVGTPPTIASPTRLDPALLLLLVDRMLSRSTPSIPPPPLAGPLLLLLGTRMGGTCGDHCDSHGDGADSDDSEDSDRSVESMGLLRTARVGVGGGRVSLGVKMRAAAPTLMLVESPLSSSGSRAKTPRPSAA